MVVFFDDEDTRHTISNRERKKAIRLKWEKGEADPNLRIFDSQPFTLAFVNLLEAAAILHEKGDTAPMPKGAVEDVAAALLLEEEKPVSAKTIARQIDDLSKRTFNVHRDSQALAASLEGLNNPGNQENSVRIRQVQKAQERINHDLIYRTALEFMGAETKKIVEALLTLEPRNEGITEALERLQASSEQLVLAEKERTPAKKVVSL